MVKKPEMTKELFDKLCELESSIHIDGFEMPNPKPAEMTVMASRESLSEQVQRLVRTELSREMRQQGYETWEESQDFDVEGDYDAEMPITEHEKIMIDEVPAEPTAPPEAGRTDPEPETESADEGAAAQPDPPREESDV